MAALEASIESSKTKSAKNAPAAKKTTRKKVAA
jgi:hypothetical protein